MKLTKVIEGGLAGASTLSLLQEALHKIDYTSPRPLLHQSGLIQKLKKGKYKGNKKSTKLYVQLASELLANAAYFGLAGLGKKKNAVVRGGVLGTVAGLGSAFLRDDDKKDYVNGHDLKTKKRDELKQKLLTVLLYTAGGVLAGAAIKSMETQKRKKKKMRK